MEHIEELRKFPLMSALSDDELGDLSKLLTNKTFDKGTDIITEGDQGSEMYLLLSGTVEIIKKTVFGDQYVCSSLDSDMHSVFGEMALIDNDKRSATVRAKTPCRVLCMTKSSFDGFIDSHPKAGIALLKVISLNLVRNLRSENENLKLVYQALIDEIENS